MASSSSAAAPTPNMTTSSPSASAQTTTTVHTTTAEIPPSSDAPVGEIENVSKKPKQKVSIREIFSPERVCKRCGQHGLAPGSSFDLHTGYDLGRYAVQQEVEKVIDEEDPDLLIGSPPCTKFSILQNLVRAKRPHGTTARTV